jgi:hypothetical protein
VAVAPATREVARREPVQPGVVVVRVHSPEFPLEHDVENVRSAASDMTIAYPIALDNDFAVWRAFATRAHQRMGRRCPGTL